jgi:hypothetical protein
MEWAGWLPSTVVVIYGQSQASKPASRSNPCNASLLMRARLRCVSGMIATSSAISETPLRDVVTPLSWWLFPRGNVVIPTLFARQRAGGYVRQSVLPCLGHSKNSPGAQSMCP